MLTSVHSERHFCCLSPVKRNFTIVQIVIITIYYPTKIRKHFLLKKIKKMRGIHWKTRQL